MKTLEDDEQHIAAAIYLLQKAVALRRDWVNKGMIHACLRDAQMHCEAARQFWTKDATAEIERVEQLIIQPRQQVYFCFFCAGAGSTEHHLIPREVQQKKFGRIIHNDSVRCCTNCHKAIHYFFCNSELAEQFNTPEKLKLELDVRIGLEAAKLLEKTCAPPNSVAVSED